MEENKAKKRSAENPHEISVIGDFSLKINFDSPLNTRVLIDALKGMDDMLSPCSRIASDVCGEKLKLESLNIGSIKKGSFDAQQIELLVQGLKVAKDMDLSTLITICFSAISFYLVKRRYDDRSEERKISSSASSSVDNSVHTNIENSVINVREGLLEQYPDQEQLIDQVVAKIEEAQTKHPGILKRAMSGLSKMAHAGGVEATGIQFGTGSQGTPPVVVNREMIQHIPVKYSEHQKIHTMELNGITIDVIRTDKESEALDAWQCRIVDEGYSQKKLPLVINAQEDRDKILQIYPAFMTVNLIVEYTYNSEGDPSYKKYIFKSFAE